MIAEPDGIFWVATCSFFVIGIYVMWLIWWAWNYKSKSQRKEEARIANAAKSRWEKSHYNTVLLPKARWEVPPDDELWRN